MKCVLFVSLLFCLESCSYINKKIGLRDDNFSEEAVETVVNMETGIDLDFTPESKEQGLIMDKGKSKGKMKIKKVIREFEDGDLHSGSKKGPKVEDKKQAVAVALSEARKAGDKIPKKVKK